MHELRLEQTALSEPNETCLVTAYNDPTNLTNVKYAERRVIKQPKTHMNKIEKITTKNNLTPLFNIEQLVQCITTRSSQHNPERLKNIQTKIEQDQTTEPKRIYLLPATQNPPEAHLKPPEQPNYNNFKQVDNQNRLDTKKTIKQEILKLCTTSQNYHKNTKHWNDFFIRGSLFECRQLCLNSHEVLKVRTGHESVNQSQPCWALPHQAKGSNTEIRSCAHEQDDSTLTGM